MGTTIYGTRQNNWMFSINHPDPRLPHTIDGNIYGLTQLQYFTFCVIASDNEFMSMVYAGLIDEAFKRIDTVYHNLKEELLKSLITEEEYYKNMIFCTCKELIKNKLDI